MPAALLRTTPAISVSPAPGVGSSRYRPGSCTLIALRSTLLRKGLAERAVKWLAHAGHQVFAATVVSPAGTCPG